MIRSVIVRQPALDDITEAVAWYEAQSSGLGEKLLEQIVHALERAQNNPELFRIVRRILTDRFPYRIFSRPWTTQFMCMRSFTARGTIVTGEGVFKRATQKAPPAVRLPAPRVLRG